MRIIGTILLALLLFAGMPAADAQDVQITLTPAAATIPGGGATTFTATVKNATKSDIYLNQIFAFFDATGDIAVDPTPFYLNFSGKLAAGTSIIGLPLFSVSSNTLLQAGTYTGTVTLYGGADGNAFNDLAQQDFRVIVIRDVTPPTTGITVGPADGGIVCSGNVTFTFTGTDNLSPAANLRYQYQRDGGATQGPFASNSASFTNLAEGLHTFSVYAVDEAGNASVNPAYRSFYVSLTPAAITGITAAPRDYRATISWTTSKPATTQLDYGATASYGMTTPLDSTRDGAHSVTLTGLTPKTTYHYRVRSSDGCRETASADQTFTTTDILLPNLTVTNFTFPGNVRPYDAVSLSWTVVNAGPGDSAQTWVDAIYLSPTNTITAGSTLLYTSGPKGPLLEFGSYTQNQTVTMPLKAAGTYYLIFKTDANNAVTETGKDDNLLALPVNYIKVSNLVAAPDQIALTLTPGNAVSGTLQLGNLSPATLTGIKAAIEDAAPNLTIQITALPASLPTLATGMAQYTIIAADETTLQSAAHLHFTTAQNEEAVVTLNVTVTPRSPQLTVTPASYTGSMLRPPDASAASMSDPKYRTLTEVEITNSGSVAATGLTVTLPTNTPWMTLVTPAKLDPIPPGGTVKIALSLRAAVGQTLGHYTGAIAVNGSNANFTIPYDFNCLSESKGTLSIVAQDEYSYFAHPPTNVANALVTLKDPQTGAVMAQGTTDTDGALVLPDLPEHYYNMEVTADKHDASRSTVQVVGGQTMNAKPFLSLQLVTYNWSVIPVDTPDQYLVTVDATFETNVPAPVVTVSPAYVDLRTLSYDASGNATVYFTITNHGLVNANSATFIPQGALIGYNITAPIQNLGTLAPLSTEVVPVTFSSSNKRAGSSCQASIVLTWEYVCFIPIVKSIAVTAVSGSCPAMCLHYDGTGGGGGAFGATSSAPSASQPQPCEPCLRKILDAILTCAELFIKFDCPQTVIKNTYKCIDSGQKNGVLSWQTADSCIFGALGIVKSCGGDAVKKAAPYLAPLLDWRKRAKCALSLIMAYDACKSLPGPGQPRFDSLTLNFLGQEAQALGVQADAFDAIFGDSAWLESAADDPNRVTWFPIFYDAVDPAGDSGPRISAAERAALLAAPLPRQITLAQMTTLIDRWNRTQDYYVAGMFYNADVPSNQSHDFIAYDTLLAKWKAASDTGDSETALGFPNPGDGLVAAAQSVQNQIVNEKAGICAQVKIQLDQTVTLTRTSFKATLDVINGPQNVPLQNVKVTLTALDAALQPVPADTFGIVGPTLTNIGDVSGTGVVNPGATGSAQWLLTPTRIAAPLNDTVYFIGGTLSYTQNGTQITVPLFPVSITVKPDPFLQFHYFWQHDVYSDDPFTPQIEPFEPYSLGLIVLNGGAGAARNLQITSSQPKIVENEKGLLIDFKIIGSQVNTGAVAPSLMVNMGDVAPGSTSVARWLMTSTLAGQFVDYSASYKHVDDLGNPKTSLIDSVKIDALEHVVRVDSPASADDGRPDFLAIVAPDLAYKLYNSDGSDAANGTPVAPHLTDAVVDGPVSLSHLNVRLTVPNVGAGWIFARLDDPAAGTNYTLLRVVRSDGREVRLNDNAWTTNRLIHLKGQNPYQQARFYLFDKDSTGSYTLVYGPPAPITVSPGGAKLLADGLQVIFSSAVVTANLPGALYVEAADRSAGLKVVSVSATEGSAVSLFGVMRTDGNGERYLDASTVSPVGSGSVDPLGMTTKTYYCGDNLFQSDTGAGQRGMTGGSGLTTTGLLTRTLGKVTALGTGTFAMDDGYGKPVTVILPAGTPPPTVGRVADVTGIASIINNNGTYTPTLRPRRAGDLFYNVDSVLTRSFVSPYNLLNSGDNLFSLPGIPANPSPVSVLSALDPGDGSGLSGRLSRYDVPMQSEVFLTTPLTSDKFGKMLLGEGYHLRLNPGSPGAAQFSGYGADAVDRWTSVAKLGAALIGDPFPYPVNWADLLVTDGTKTVSLTDAARTLFPPWLSSKARYYDSVAQAYRILGLPDDRPDSGQMTPWTAYFVTSNRDNLALIAPAATVFVSGKLNFEGIYSGAAAQNVIFEFRPVGNGAVFRRAISVGPDGTFALPNIPRYNYQVWIKGDKYLSRVVLVDATQGGATAVNALLPAADGNNDNVIDSSDFSLLIGAFNSDARIAGSGYDYRADFNSDGAVDSSDFTLLIGNFNAKGDL